MKSSIFTLLICLLLIASFNCNTDRTAGTKIPDQSYLVGALEKPLRYEIEPGAIIRFALDSLPAITGEDAVVGMKDTFFVYWENGEPEVRFNAIIYNSSRTETFHINPYDSLGNIDTTRWHNGDARNVFKAELLSTNGTVLRVAEKTDFCVCESRPVSEGFPPSELPLTLAPQWADWYSYTTPGQDFSLAGLRFGRYRVQFWFDPNNWYQQRQRASWDVIWDGLRFYTVKQSR